MDTPRSTYPTFSWTERRRLLRALEQAHDARLYRRLRAVAEIAEGEPVAVVAKHARMERNTVYRWIERYLAERAPCSLADGKQSGRPRMTPALTHAVQQILARIPVAAHLATYLVDSHISLQIQAEMESHMDRLEALHTTMHGDGPGRLSVAVPTSQARNHPGRPGEAQH